jgi:hypothetical protein
MFLSKLKYHQAVNAILGSAAAILLGRLQKCEGPRLAGTQSRGASCFLCASDLYGKSVL